MEVRTEEGTHPRRRRRGPDPQGAEPCPRGQGIRGRDRRGRRGGAAARGELRAGPGGPRPEPPRHRRVRGLPAAPDVVGDARHRALGPGGRGRQGRGARSRRRRLPDQAVRDRRAARPRSARCSAAARTGARRSRRGSSPTGSRSTWRRTGSCATARAFVSRRRSGRCSRRSPAIPGKLLTHGWLLTHVWGEGYADDVDVLRVFVSQLRKKIEREHTRPTIIVTEPGVGYRWVLRAAPADDA